MSANDLIGVAPVLRDELAGLEAADGIVGTLADLTTQAKTSAVAAINEVAGKAQTALARVAAAQPDSTATDIAGIVADVNALLAKLRAAGLLGS